jgi:hypothetical protein
MFISTCAQVLPKLRLFLSPTPFIDSTYFNEYRECVLHSSCCPHFSEQTIRKYMEYVLHGRCCPRFRHLLGCPKSNPPRKRSAEVATPWRMGMGLRRKWMAVLLFPTAAHLPRDLEIWSGGTVPSIGPRPQTSSPSQMGYENGADPYIPRSVYTGLYIHVYTMFCPVPAFEMSTACSSIALLGSQYRLPATY